MTVFITMETKHWLKLILINFGVGLLIISPFLPGPSNGLVHLFFNAGQILGLFGIIIIPIGLTWTIREFNRRKKNVNHRVDLNALITLTLPITIFLTSNYISDLAREFSRDFAINRTDKLIQSIETFKKVEGEYPDSLTELTPEFIASIPFPSIMGINQFYYERIGDNCIISFHQNVSLGINYEVVFFDQTDSHKAEGELTTIYDTGKKYWKYYVYD